MKLVSSESESFAHFGIELLGRLMLFMHSFIWSMLSVLEGREAFD